MCCGEAFWKRVVAFSLTFGFGVLAAGLFISGKVPQAVKPIAVSAPPENKNCVPVDESLRYETLESKKPTSPAQLEETKQPEAKKPEDKEIALKQINKKIYPQIEPEKQTKSAEPQYYEPSKNPAEVKDLLHKERCFEAQAQ